MLASITAAGQRSDDALRRAISDDAASPAAVLTAPELLARADVYASNRMFPQARGHWQKYLADFPNGTASARALFGIARSFMWERDYQSAVIWFDKLLAGFPDTKDGREGLAFKGASLIRLGRNLEAANVYQQYIVRFPTGERIDSAHLNLIDAYREAGKYADANAWIDRTAERFAGKPAQVNALHARIRMEIFRENWEAAVKASDELLNVRTFTGSMTTADEVRYLKAFALDRTGKSQAARDVYRDISTGSASYFGGLAAEKIGRLIADATSSPISAAEFPVLFKMELLGAAKRNDIDPRFLLAIMKQESSFRAAAKSPAGARGLLQLVFDTAIKYKEKAGFPNLQPDDLYNPATNIAIGSTYISALKKQFGGLYEAIAASYNGGEDNAARWLKRSKPKDPGIFASEVGFAESKNYVFKVMNNYRAYRLLYTEDLSRR